jgi:NAD(P) transhydrogenase subunit alpha
VEGADIVAKVRPPTEAEAKRLKGGQTLISFFYPAENEALLNRSGQDQGRHRHRHGHGAADQPRAEDGRAVVDGQYRGLPRGDRGGQQFRPLLHRPGDRRGQGAAGQGAGGRRRRRGLAAIGTSTSLGAITYAFDVRPEVAEQIESMGAEFVYLDFEESSQDGAATGGYAAPSSPNSAKSSWRSSASWRPTWTSSSPRR